MTDKEKRFPLSLASLGARTPQSIDDRNAARRAVATPQTATRNLARHGERDAIEDVVPTARDVAVLVDLAADGQRDAIR